MSELITIVLADGTVLGDLVRNGTNYISQSEINRSVFQGNCSPLTVRITGDEEVYEEVHENAALVHLTRMGDEYWFAFRDISEREMNEAKIRSDIDYIAMMADIDLDEEV